VNIVERAHPDLGRLGVFWHTQGSGKSYSMAFFTEKVLLAPVVINIWPRVL
jgi:type I restriction enzyme R subunit